MPDPGTTPYSYHCRYCGKSFEIYQPARDHEIEHEQALIRTLHPQHRHPWSCECPPCWQRDNVTGAGD